MRSTATTTPSPKRQLCRTLVEQLFVRMQSIYGHLWSSRFPTAQMLAAAKNEWGAALYGLHIDRINRALDICATRQVYPTPPTLPQFGALCQPQLAPYHKPAPKALPAPTNRALGLSVLGELKRRFPKRQLAEQES